MLRQAFVSCVISSTCLRKLSHQNHWLSTFPHGRHYRNGIITSRPKSRNVKTLPGMLPCSTNCQPHFCMRIYIYMYIWTNERSTMCVLTGFRKHITYFSEIFMQNKLVPVKLDIGGTTRRDQCGHDISLKFKLEK